MSYRAAWLVTASLIPAVAFAQPAAKLAPAPQPAAKPSTVGEVVVTGQAAEGVRTSIDRRSYSITGDLQTTAGSVADALRNVPSLEVDVRGNLSLRGDPNVTILIDGKPSSLFTGEARGDALQQMPAQSIERVEVITNPSAAFRPDGTGGIINLVTKQTRKAGKSGSVRANYGSEGRYNAGLTLSYNSPKLTVTADGMYRMDVQGFRSTDERSRRDPATGQVSESQLKVDGASDVEVWMGRVAADYDLNARDRISGEVRYFNVHGVNRSVQVYDAPTLAYDRLGDGGIDLSNAFVSANWRRKLGEDHLLTGLLSVERSENRFGGSGVFAQRLPTPGPRAEDSRIRQDTDGVNAKLEYSRPMPDRAKLQLGYELDADSLKSETRLLRGTTLASLAVDTAFSNRFLYDQQVHSLYGTYERPFGDFTVLGGLRLVQLLSDFDQVTSGVKAQNDYLRAYPSLHLSYRLSDAQSLSASYSHRVARPSPQDLNPFRVYGTPFQARAGNPNLKPADTHSFELGYQLRRNGAFYLATLYYRKTEDAFTDVLRDLGGGTFLTTRENLAENQMVGLELTTNGRLSPKLSYNLIFHGFWDQVDGTAFGAPGTRSNTSGSVRGTLNWQVRPKDLLQVSGGLAAQRLNAQGYVTSGNTLNLGYRHQYSSDLAFVVSVQDLLNTFEGRQTVRTPTLNTTVRNYQRGQMISVGFSKTFGGAKRAPVQDFDFGGGPGAAPPP